MHADISPLATGVALPAKRASHFHGNPGRDIRWQNTLLVSSVLLIKDFPRGHADYPCLNAFRFQLLVSLNAERELAACADQDHLRFSAFGICQYGCTLCNSGGGSIF